jgi:hypothetical protein
LSDDDWHQILLQQANQVACQFPDVADYLRLLMNNMPDIRANIDRTTNNYPEQLVAKGSVNGANLACYQFLQPNVQDCQEMLKLIGDNITSDVPSANYRYYYDSCAIVQKSSNEFTFNTERVAVTMFHDCMVGTVDANKLLDGWASTVQSFSQSETACLVHVGAAPYCLPFSADSGVYDMLLKGRDHPRVQPRRGAVPSLPVLLSHHQLALPLPVPRQVRQNRPTQHAAMTA